MMQVLPEVCLVCARKVMTKQETMSEIALYDPASW
jgi:hypothetical protein